MLHKGFECSFYFIRHAESERNLESHLVGGRCPTVPLSQRGMLQAAALGERLRDEKIPIDFAYTSPTMRAYDTAAIALTTIHYPLDAIVQVEALNEINQGDWEAERRDNVYHRNNLLYIMRKGPTFAPPNGESQERVEQRITNWVHDTFIYNREFVRSHNKASIAIFSHAITLKALFHSIMGFDRRFIYLMHCDNASISEFTYNERGWQPKRINDVAHVNKVGYLSQKF